MNARKVVVGEESGIVIFWCPGCDENHVFRIKPWIRDGKKGPVWRWDGDENKPTFRPSLITHPDIKERRCHLTLHDGVIEFCSDCHHELAGKRVPLPDYPC